LAGARPRNLEAGGDGLLVDLGSVRGENEERLLATQESYQRRAVRLLSKLATSEAGRSPHQRHRIARRAALLVKRASQISDLLEGVKHPGTPLMMPRSAALLMSPQGPSGAAKQLQLGGGKDDSASVYQSEDLDQQKTSATRYGVDEDASCSFTAAMFAPENNAKNTTLFNTDAVAGNATAKPTKKKGKCGSTCQKAKRFAAKSKEKAEKAHGAISSKLNLKTMMRLVKCATGLMEQSGTLDFKASISFKEKNQTGVAKFLTKVFPTNYQLHVTLKNMINGAMTRKDTIFQACVLLGKASNLTDTITLYAPRLCLKKHLEYKNIDTEGAAMGKLKGKIAVKALAHAKRMNQRGKLKGPGGSAIAALGPKYKWKGKRKQRPVTLELTAAMGIKVKDDKLTLMGTIKLNKDEAYLHAMMKGIWKNPFGIPNIAIGHLGVGVGFPLSPAVATPSIFTFAGMIGLGKATDCKKVMLTQPSTGGELNGTPNSTAGELAGGRRHRTREKLSDNCISGRIALQTNAKDPEQNYISATVGPLSYKHLMNWVNTIFGKKEKKKQISSGGGKLTAKRAASRSKERAKKAVQKKKQAANAKFFDLINFPKGFAMSIAAQPQMAAGGFKIPAGIAVTGMIRVKYLGFGYVKVQCDVDNEIFIAQIEMSPVNLGSLKILRNMRDKDLGPKLFIEMNGITSMVAINLEGVISIWGLNTYVRMIADPNGFHFVTSAPIAFGLLTSRLMVQAKLPFGKKNNVSDTSVSFDAQLLRGPLMTVMYPKVKAAVKEYVKKMLSKLGDDKKKEEASHKLEAHEQAEVNRAHLYWERYYNTRLGEAVKPDPLDQTLGEDGIDTTMDPEEAAEMLGDTNHAAWGRRRKKEVEEKKEDGSNATTTASKDATRRRRFSVFRRGVSYKQGAKEGTVELKAILKKVNFWKAVATAIKRGTVFSFCGARTKGKFGLKSPPTLSLEVEILLLGARQNFKLVIDTNGTKGLKKTAISFAKAVFTPLTVLWKTFNSTGSDVCNIKLPDLTKPLKRTLPLPALKGNTSLPSATSVLASTPKRTFKEGSLDEAPFKKQMSDATKHRVYHIGYQAGFLHTSDSAKITAEKRAEDETELSLDTVKSVFEQGYAAGHNDRKTGTKGKRRKRRMVLTQQ